MRMEYQKDFSASGLKFIGPYENDRNACNADVYKAIIREAYGVTDVICGHHLVLVVTDPRNDGFSYTVVEEIPAADTLIFDHEIARKIWGDTWREALTALALEPIETRDDLLAKMYYGRAGR